MDVGFQTRSTFKMTRGTKYNTNPKLKREQSMHCIALQFIVFFKQQTIQVAMFMVALEKAYKKIEILEGALMSPSQGAFRLTDKPRFCLPYLRIKL